MNCVLSSLNISKSHFVTFAPKSPRNGGGSSRESDFLKGKYYRILFLLL